MNIQELEDKYEQIWIESDKVFASNEIRYTKLSVEFAIEQLEDLLEIFNNFDDDDWWYIMKVEDKIQELKECLNEKS